jgi:hypothetical protein
LTSTNTPVTANDDERITVVDGTSFNAAVLRLVAYLEYRGAITPRDETDRAFLTLHAAEVARVLAYRVPGGVTNHERYGSTPIKATDPANDVKACAICRRPLGATRNGTRTCSPRCRQQAYRDRQSSIEPIASDTRVTDDGGGYG